MVSGDAGYSFYDKRPHERGVVNLPTDYVKVCSTHTEKYIKHTVFNRTFANVIKCSCQDNTYICHYASGFHQVLSKRKSGLVNKTVFDETVD